MFRMVALQAGLGGQLLLRQLVPRRAGEAEKHSLLLNHCDDVRRVGTLSPHAQMCAMPATMLLKWLSFVSTVNFSDLLCITTTSRTRLARMPTG